MPISHYVLSCQSFFNHLLSHVFLTSRSLGSGYPEYPRMTDGLESDSGILAVGPVFGRGAKTIWTSSNQNEFIYLFLTLPL